MMKKFRRLWGNLLSSFWFIPSLIVTGSVGLALALVELDLFLGTGWIAPWPHILGVGAEGARGLLSTIAGSMMTVVGVTFSMTLVTLGLASSQYTSRILRNFMRDRVTQVVLGIFAGIFTYCLIVLRTIRSGDEREFVPSLAVAFGVVLALVGIGILILFIHHIASAIQASTIISRVAHETLEAIDRLFPSQIGQEHRELEGEVAEVPPSQRIWQTVPSRVTGYIQSLDESPLLRLACESDTVIRMEHGIGDFVVEGTALASIAMESVPEEDTIAAIQEAYCISSHRTLEQDAAFGIRQIVDMPMRALSPSTNDTTTAVMCVDYLTAILARLVLRSIPSAYRYEEGKLRLLAVGPSFSHLLDEAFDQIRGSAAGNVAILLRVLGGLKTVASLTTNPSRRALLSEHVQRLAEAAEITLVIPHDLARFKTRLRQVQRAFVTG